MVQGLGHELPKLVARVRFPAAASHHRRAKDKFRERIQNEFNFFESAQNGSSNESELEKNQYKSVILSSAS